MSNNNNILFKIKGEKTLYLVAFSVDDGPLDDPQFASIMVDEEFIDQLNQMKGLFQYNYNLTEVRTLNGPIWRPSKEGEESYDERLSLEELCVARSGFWFRALGKNGGAIESQHLPWSELESILVNQDPVAYQVAALYYEERSNLHLKILIDSIWEEETENHLP